MRPASPTTRTWVGAPWVRSQAATWSPWMIWSVHPSTAPHRFPRMVTRTRWPLCRTPSARLPRTRPSWTISRCRTILWLRPLTVTCAARWSCVSSTTARTLTPCWACGSPVRLVWLPALCAVCTRRLRTTPVRPRASTWTITRRSSWLSSGWRRTPRLPRLCAAWCLRPRITVAVRFWLSALTPPCRLSKSPG